MQHGPCATLQCWHTAVMLSGGYCAAFQHQDSLSARGLLLSIHGRIYDSFEMQGLVVAPASSVSMFPWLAPLPFSRQK